MLGELPPAATLRLDLPPLSPAAVETLARQAARSAAGIHAATLGNPFFVTEVLRDADAVVPRSVQDLVLARLARLPEQAQAVARLVAVMPRRAENRLIETLLAPPLQAVEACLASGLLVADATALRYRHELGRVAVESSLSAPAALALHRRLLAELSTPARAAEPARIVHHAVRAADAQAVGQYAPLAAEQARQRGAHREAAAHWRTALRDGASADDAQRLDWLENYALECQLTDQLEEAIVSREQLAKAYRAAGQLRREALNLSRRALVHVLALRNADAERDSHRALELLAPLPACAEQATAYWVQAQLRMLNRDCEQSAAASHKAIALAQAFDDRSTEVAALGTLGTAMLFIDHNRGVALLQQALDAAREADLHWVAANTYTNLGSGSGELFRFEPAQEWLREGLAYAERHEIDFYRHYAMAWLALCELYTGQWNRAAEHAADVVAHAGGTTTSRVMALVALGRLRVRRGDPGAAEALDAALELAQRSGTLQRLAPVRAARAEWAIARGDAAAAAAEVNAALPLASQHRHPWFIGELALQGARAGLLGRPPADCASPFALEIEGHWREAAAAWQALNCPYEQARALARGDAEAQRQALAIFDRLGAGPATAELRRRMHEAGLRRLARGARPSTRENPAGLTSAELKILALLAEGLRNAQMAARLHRSVRTVDHHVAAVLAKLGARTRTEAVQRALSEGWIAPVPQDGQRGGSI